MIILALKAGLRQGELLALRREDIDLVTGLLRVRRSVTRGFVTAIDSRSSSTLTRRAPQNGQLKKKIEPTTMKAASVAASPSMHATRDRPSRAMTLRATLTSWRLNLEAGG